MSDTVAEAIAIGLMRTAFAAVATFGFVMSVPLLVASAPIAACGAAAMSLSGVGLIAGTMPK